MYRPSKLEIFDRRRLWQFFDGSASGSLEIFRQECSQVVRLLPQFGHGCRLKEPSFLRASQRVKVRNDTTGSVQKLPLVIYVESEKQRVGSGQAAEKELEHQRISKFVIVALWSGAVDHEANRQLARDT
jgi:hypothetical protein